MSTTAVLPAEASVIAAPGFAIRVSRSSLNYEVLLAHAGDADRVWLGGIEMRENTRNALVTWLIAASNRDFVILGFAPAGHCLAGKVARASRKSA